MKKRLISILVAMALLLGTMPVSVFAEEDENNTDPDVQVVDTEEEAPSEEEPVSEEPDEEEPEETEAVEPEETEPSEEIAEAVVPVYEDPADPDQDETEMIPVDLDTVVTPDNFFEFFNDYGELLETAGDELTFKGDFSEIDLNTIIIGKQVAITSDGAVFKNVCFYVVSGEVSIDGIKIIDNDKKNGPAVINIEGGEDIKITNCTIEYTKESGDNGSCIHACNSDKLSITGGKFKYTGDTDSSNFNRPIWVEGGSDITIKDNTIEASIPSADVNYTEDFAMVYMSVGISLNDCKGVDLINNNVTVTSAGKSGYYPTACAVSITSTKLTIKDNTISITGSDYVYGFDAAADLLDCSGNTVNVTSDHYGSAFQLTGPATSEI
ncbi:MAG: right-handed parallel beta-helix repeat-containing protein, partial [Clostridiales bacterium]|nr:right-handed parallel beta-helix repeat-containing protein [Clostridiales bacterium]